MPLFHGFVSGSDDAGMRSWPLRALAFGKWQGTSANDVCTLQEMSETRCFACHRRSRAKKWVNVSLLHVTALSHLCYPLISPIITHFGPLTASAIILVVPSQYHPQ